MGGSIERVLFTTWWIAVLLMWPFASDRLAAQERARVERRVVAGARYEAGAFHRFLLGTDYRDLWTTPINVPVLDLQRFAGGLRPVMRVGGQQSLGLALEGEDGRDYTFRGIDKDPSGVLPDDLQDTFIEGIVQDQISAAHPAGALVAEELSRAAGVPTVDSRIVVMGDDPALGEFRDAFAGRLGTIAVFPQPVSETNPGFEGVTEIIDHLELYERIRASPEDRVDAEALLRARLFDVLIGDWDRHRKQWRWAKTPGDDAWRPIPEDRDQAFSRFDGVILGIARTVQPRLVAFEDDYPRILGLTWNGWEQDRVLLTGLEWPVWERIARDLQTRVTDAAIDRAVRRMPPEYYALEGDRLETALRSRRDGLLDAARDFYEFLAQTVDAHATRRSEVARIEWEAGGHLHVTIFEDAADARPRGEPVFERTFLPDETDEVRVFLYGGDDRVLVRGPAGGIRLRVIGGDGEDVLDDSDSGSTQYYDASGATDLRRGPGTALDTREYEAPVPVPHVPWLPPRDWGSQTTSLPLSGWSEDFGFFLGGLVDHRRFGFRKNPYSSRHTIAGGYAFGAATPRVEYNGELRLENSDAYWSVRALVGGLELLRYFGPGNETTDDRSPEFFEVEQTQFHVSPGYTFPIGDSFEATLAPLAKFTSNEENPDHLVGQQQPYGSGDFGQLGASLGLKLDTRDAVSAPTRGVHLRATGTIYPSWWDVQETFGQLSGDVSTYLTTPGRLQTTLALRVGGQQNWGMYPFHESAFIGGGGFFGGRQAVRGLLQNRFAGDAALFGNAELRTRLGRIKLGIPAEVGIVAFADVGRVFLEEEDSDTWHDGLGGGISLAFLQRSNVLSIMGAESEGRVGLYIRMGFAF